MATISHEPGRNLPATKSVKGRTQRTPRDGGPCARAPAEPAIRKPAAKTPNTAFVFRALPVLTSPSIFNRNIPLHNVYSFCGSVFFTYQDITFSAHLPGPGQRITSKSLLCDNSWCRFARFVTRLQGDHIWISFNLGIC